MFFLRLCEISPGALLYFHLLPSSNNVLANSLPKIALRCECGSEYVSVFYHLTVQGGHLKHCATKQNIENTSKCI